MPQINREGTFNAVPVKFGVREIGNNNLAAVEIEFDIRSECGRDSVDVDVSADQFTITKAFFFEKRDHTINEHAVKSLRGAFGWDGCEVLWFETTDLSAHPVQLVIAWERKKDRNELTVKYLNAYGSHGGGGVRSADEATQRAIQNRLGHKLRAIRGGTPRTPTPATGPASGAQTPPAAPAATQEPTATQNEAWTAYENACDPTTSEDDRVKQWFELVKLITGQSRVEYVTPESWYKVKMEAPLKVKPPAPPDQAQGLRDAAVEMPDVSDKLVNQPEPGNESEPSMPMHDRPASPQDIEQTKVALNAALKSAGADQTGLNRKLLAKYVADKLGFDAQKLTSGQSGALRRSLRLVSDNPAEIQELLGMKGE